VCSCVRVVAKDGEEGVCNDAMRQRSGDQILCALLQIVPVGRQP
jgi:hypothetical protein